MAHAVERRNAIITKTKQTSLMGETSCVRNFSERNKRLAVYEGEKICFSSFSKGRATGNMGGLRKWKSVRKKHMGIESKKGIYFPSCVWRPVLETDLSTLHGRRLLDFRRIVMNAKFRKQANGDMVNKTTTLESYESWGWVGKKYGGRQCMWRKRGIPKKRERIVMRSSRGEWSERREA